MEKKKLWKKRALEDIVIGCAMMGAIWFVSAICGVVFKVLGV